MLDKDISQIIIKDREISKNGHFEGTFIDYVNLIKAHPEIAILAHQRMFDIITSQGFEAIKTDEDPRLRRIYGNDVIKKYKFL